MTAVVGVYELTQTIRRVIVDSDELTHILVRGEVSNVSRPASGHLYFTLKDERARLRVVMFAGKARYLRFAVQDGMSVVVGGAIDVFERSGDYQLYAETVQPDGIGALYLAFEQLKEKLAGEGLFSPERKRPLPTFPSRIALVTSATGAAVRDMITTLRRRYPLGQVLVVPVAVQGEDAPKQIAEGIQLVCRRRLADVMIVGRGGGSFEELFAFNTEIVARAIAVATIPVVSAVGHETDTTIADLVADVRAATPTGAAELISRDSRELDASLEVVGTRLVALARQAVARGRERLTRLAAAKVLHDPVRPVALLSERVDSLERQLRSALRRPIEVRSIRLADFELRLARRSPVDRLRLMGAEVERFDVRCREATRRLFQAREAALYRHVEHLDLLSPLAVMKRGYAVLYRKGQGNVLATIDQVQPGDSVEVRVIDGWLDCQVWGVHEDERDPGRESANGRNGSDGADL